MSRIWTDFKFQEIGAAEDYAGLKADIDKDGTAKPSSYQSEIEREMQTLMSLPLHRSRPSRRATMTTSGTKTPSRKRKLAFDRWCQIVMGVEDDAEADERRSTIQETKDILTEIDEDTPSKKAKVEVPPSQFQLSRT